MLFERLALGGELLLGERKVKLGVSRTNNNNNNNNSSSNSSNNIMIIMIVNVNVIVSSRSSACRFASSHNMLAYNTITYNNIALSSSTIKRCQGF